MRAPSVLIAGAGIAGLASALALARVGIASSVLEQAPALAEIGAGLQLSPNATRILARLGVLDRLAREAPRPSAVRVRNAGGRTLSLLPLEDSERRWGSPYLVARRALLQRVLHEAALAEPAITLHLGTALAGFGTTSEGIAVTAKQGQLSRSFVADALIGADGVRSSVRRKLVAAAADAPRDTGRTAWRATVAAADLDPELRGAETGLWLGRDAHLVHYALGDTINVVAITRDGTADAPGDLWARPGDCAAIRTRYARWHPAARALIAAAPSWTGWPLFERNPLPAWNAGPVALVGDAAHPILPFLAQGAAQAIEDAAALAMALAAGRDVPAALAAYSAARVARATRVQKASQELGRIYHLAGPAAAARDAGMRLIGSRRLLERYDWLYGGGAVEAVTVTQVTGRRPTA